MSAEDSVPVSPQNAGASLVAKEIGVHFEGLQALVNVDLYIADKEILGLIGPNGAGKTTLVNVLSGYQKPDMGKIVLAGNDTTGWPAHVFARKGLGRTFQAARLFPELSVLENVEMPGVGLGARRTTARRKATEILQFLDIDHRRDIRADALSYGEVRLVGIARALAISPRFLLLDEPAAGLSPQEAHDLMQRIARIRDRFSCGILVIEHNMQVIMRLCDRVQVLAQGNTIAVGTPKEIQSSQAVRNAYLGTRQGMVTEEPTIEAKTIAFEPVFSIDQLVVEYGSVRALSGVSLHAGRGEFVSVIGPNGAGKSTLLAAVTGLVKPKSGKIRFEGDALGHLSAAARVNKGIALIPEGRRILSNLTVEENLRVGQMTKRHEMDARNRFEDVLERFPILRERLKGYAGRLSGGEQQQLAIARSLLSGPRLLLLDEPSLGLAPQMIEQVYETLVALRKTGLTILLMEQNANRALKVADRAYVLRHGAVELEGNAAALITDPAFDRAYFGFDADGGDAVL